MSGASDTLGATVDMRTFTHDGAGNVLTAANAAGAYTRTYDELDRLETQSGLWGVGYTFDYNDRERTGVTDTLGGDADWVRDDAGRVTRRTFTDGTDEMRIDLGYNARDERTSETRYADIGGTTLVGTTVRGYDDAGNLTGLHYKDAGAATISDYVNAFDAADRITSETRNGGAAVTFSYDTTSQLVADSAASYSYDLAGNRTMAGYATGASNRITSDGTWAFSHDDEGNVTKRSKGALAETWTYGYDHDNQMLWAEQRATDGGALLMRLDFTYDVFSQRVKEVKTVGATTTERRYTFADRGEVEAELDATNALVTRYLRGEAAGELWGRVGAGGAEWLLQDRLGSLRDVADAAGAGVDHIDYDGFGNVTAESAPALTGDFTYTGLWRQRETGLFHAFWRDYGPSWGGWMQDDPSHIEGGGDANVRRYCGNNPTNLVDLSGLESAAYVRSYTSERFREEAALARLERLAGDPATNSFAVDGVLTLYGYEMMEHLGFRRYVWSLNPFYWEETDEYSTFKQGCMGLCKIRMGELRKEVFHFPGARAFATLDAAVAAQKEMIKANTKGMRVTVVAYQDDFLNNQFTSMLLPKSTTEYDIDKIKEIRGRFGGKIVARGRLVTFDFVTIHQNDDLSVRFYETMDFGVTNNPTLKVKHKKALYSPDVAGTIYIVVAIRDHYRAPRSPRGELDE